MVMVALALGLVLGMLLVYASYASDLRRIAQFLRGRDRSSNARVTLGSLAPGLPQLADAVNAELDAASEAHVAAERHAAEFRRDLSALSHDIRTPLMGAKGYLQLAADETDAEHRAHLLGSAAERLDDTETLLDQLFAYTKASDPDLGLTMGPVALQPLVADVLVGQYPEFEARGWAPDVRLAEDDVCVEADGEQLRRILENLVTNALRYGVAAPRVVTRVPGEPETGRREGCTAAVGAGAPPAAQCVVLEISNSVANPAALDVGRLFGRFYQADASRGGRGAGLGLSVAAKLAAAMDMRISASLDGDVLTISLVMQRVA